MAMRHPRTKDSTAVSFDRVSYRINQHSILQDISLSIATGEIAGILGPNGAGKTTLLSLITGLKNPSQGNITLFSDQHPHDNQARQHIGVVLQETALYDELTTHENLQFAASLYAIQDVKSRINEVLHLLDLADKADQPVKILSGGMRRRVAIARAFLHDPELLVIDEPTLGVDVEARHAIWSHLRLLQTKGRTIVVATNYLDEAQALCNTVAILQRGKLVANESPTDLINRVGSCLDIYCQEKEAKKIATQLAKESSVIRTDHTATGLSIFLKGSVVPEAIVTGILKHASISEFRLRSPDLAEVFKAIQKPV